jgi:hypothetical protein|tara:strand:- start:298 stop:834 length:537 start_codon:yes stop_codon:yes gene_type:complete
MQGGRMVGKVLLLLIALVLSVNSHASNKKIYAWKDKNGVLVFSDTPQPGAKEVKLTSQHLNMPATNTDILDTSPTKTAVKFKISITSPEPNQTIRENTGSVYVSTQIAPRFEAGFTIGLFLNGIAIGEPSDTTTLALRDVERGQHTLQVKLYNKQNQVIATSPESVFFMHRKGLNIGR